MSWSAKHDIQYVDGPFISLLHVYASQTNDDAGHPVDITLEWAECSYGLPDYCDLEAAALQPVITCAGDTKSVSIGGGTVINCKVVRVALSP